MSRCAYEILSMRSIMIAVLGNKIRVPPLEFRNHLSLVLLSASMTQQNPLRKHTHIVWCPLSQRLVKRSYSYVHQTP